MLTVTCDITGKTETIDLADVEVREGKRQGEWVWYIKGIEKFEHFAPDAINRELNLVLSNEAKADWEAKDSSLKEQALTDRMKAIKDMKRNKTNTTTTTNMNNT